MSYRDLPPEEEQQRLAKAVLWAAVAVLKAKAKAFEAERKDAAPVDALPQD